MGSRMGSCRPGQKMPWRAMVIGVVEFQVDSEEEEVVATSLGLLGKDGEGQGRQALDWLPSVSGAPVVEPMLETEGTPLVVARMEGVQRVVVA
mmetsp:Transcript_46498/g.108362  ORF Transcript_46498/g.108362 Transcript_46498/m.108362 type:complete len:93 (+) Transcript_46498:40-318(+)